MFVEKRVEEGYISKKEAQEVLKLCGFVETSRKDGFWTGGKNAPSAAAIVSQNVATKKWKIRFGTAI